LVTSLSNNMKSLSPPNYLINNVLTESLLIVRKTSRYIRSQRWMIIFKMDSLFTAIRLEMDHKWLPAHWWPCQFPVAKSEF
jgi:hypothetical protein